MMRSTNPGTSPMLFRNMPRIDPPPPAGKHVTKHSGCGNIRRRSRMSDIWNCCSKFLRTFSPKRLVALLHPRAQTLLSSQRHRLQDGPSLMAERGHVRVMFFPVRPSTKLYIFGIDLSYSPRLRSNEIVNAHLPSLSTRRDQPSPPPPRRSGLPIAGKAFWDQKDRMDAVAKLRHWNSWQRLPRPGEPTQISALDSST